MESFCSLALARSAVATGSKSHRYFVRVVSTPFFALRYVNDPIYLPGDDNSMKNRRLRLEEANLELKGAAVKAREDYRK